MKWYWVIPPDGEPEPPCFIGDRGSLFSEETSVLWSGRRIEDWPPTHTIRSTKKRNDGAPWDVLASYLPAPVLSPRLQQALRVAGVDDLQFLPIHVLRSTGETLPGFAVANVFAAAAALDLEKSAYQRFPADFPAPERVGEISSLEKPVLVREGLEGRHIVRLEEYLHPLYASEHFKRVFEQGGFRGYQFIEIPVTSRVVH
jgi:hypothetical protein